MDARNLLHVLEEITGLPTAPYHEGALIRNIEEFADRRGIGRHRDQYGNILLHLDQGEVGGTPLVLTAHMDHPGFEITGREGDLYRARWLGSVAPDYFPDAEVEVFGSPPVPGRIIRYSTDDEGRVDEIFLELDDEVAEGACGTWALNPWRLEPPLVHLRAGDNLVGLAAILAVLEVLWARQDPINLLVAFTRAEEVGFLGALGLMTAELLPAHAPILTLECSGELPHVQLGRGPVVRIGDRLGVFDLGLTHYLCEVAEDLSRKFRDFSWQRGLMDRGTCESTLFALHGHPTACLAFPLGNYHNCAADGYSVVSEQIHLADFFGGVTLLAEGARRWAVEGPRAASRLRERVVERAMKGMVRLANDELSG